MTKCIGLFPELFNGNLSLPEPSASLSPPGETPVCAASPPDWSVRPKIPDNDLPSPPSQPQQSQENFPIVPLTSRSLTLNIEPKVELCGEKLNYLAIHEELEGHSVRGKLLLMQALRWVNNT